MSVASSCLLLPPASSSSSSSSPPLLLLLLLLSSSSSSSSSCSTAIHVSVPCRTSTTTIHAQCSLPDLNHDHPRPVFPAGLNHGPSTPSVPCRTSTTTIRASVPCRTSTTTIPAQCSLPDLMWEDMGQRMCRRES